MKVKRLCLLFALLLATFPLMPQAPNRHMDVTNCILIGLNAGRDLVHGNGNIFIGKDAGADVASANHLFILALGNGKFLRFKMDKEDQAAMKNLIEDALHSLSAGGDIHPNGELVK